jgi:hypothetical protein
MDNPGGLTRSGRSLFANKLCAAREVGFVIWWTCALEQSGLPFEEALAAGPAQDGASRPLSSWVLAVSIGDEAHPGRRHAGALQLYR